jgi:uncharacterized LabA/DUF88 family protein
MKEKNVAYVDAQNMHFGTTKCYVCAECLKKDLHSMKLSDCICGAGWEIDLARFRVYLRDKYGVDEAYYFLGYLHEENDELYKRIQKAGFIVIFKEHHRKAKSNKKGNVDTDIVFEIMKSLTEGTLLNKIVLVSGDGDYNKLVQYLVLKSKFRKILFPNKKFASSLYKSLGSEFFDYLENVKSHIAKKEGKKERGS